MLDEQPEQNPTLWIGIPSIPARRVGQALVVFLFALTAAIVIDALLITHNQKPETWQLTAEAIFDDGGSIVAWAIAATWPIMEVLRMVLASIWENRIRRRAIEQGLKQGLERGRQEASEEARQEGREEGRQEGREEALAENQRLWLAWNRRRQDAEERGVPFTEPPPSLESGDTA